MTGITAAALALLFAAAPPLSFLDRVEGERAVEKARYAFVVGATKPFDEAYPRAVFEEKVGREIREEKVLSREFGITVTPELLAKEYERIERETKAPEQWAAIKAALGTREKVEQVVCRPLLVERGLRTRFAFDPRIHEKEHETAREARRQFLAGQEPTGSRTIRLSRKAEPAGTDELLAKAQRDAAGPKPPVPAEPEKTGAPLPVDPEMARVLERELKANGDVTTILEERDRFSVFRLVAAGPDDWLVEGIQVPKRNFEEWLAAKIEAGAKR